jgi:hypothetical protein
MSPTEFERQVLALWMQTRIPLTLVNVVYCTGAPRKKATQWLDKMVAEHVLEVDADDEGELIWSVRGSPRANNGPTNVAEWSKVGQLRGQVGAATSALALAGKAAGLTGPKKDGDKSLIASGLLSFFFGPFGWLYAAPLVEVIPAILIWIIIGAIFPGFLLKLILPLIGPISALAGVAYAWKYNNNGERTPLFIGKGDNRSLPPKSSK